MNLRSNVFVLVCYNKLHSAYNYKLLLRDLENAAKIELHRTRTSRGKDFCARKTNFSPADATLRIINASLRC